MDDNCQLTSGIHCACCDYASNEIERLRKIEAAARNVESVYLRGSWDGVKTVTLADRERALDGMFDTLGEK